MRRIKHFLQTIFSMRNTSFGPRVPRGASREVMLDSLIDDVQTQAFMEVRHDE
jgi:hypothetical protein